MPSYATLAEFPEMKIVYLQMVFWNHPSVAFTILSEPPVIC